MTSHRSPIDFLLPLEHSESIKYHERVAPITPSYLGRSVPMTATWHVVEVSTPRHKPPEVSALRSVHRPCVCHVWCGPRGRKPLGLVVYKPLYFVPRRISNRARLSSPQHFYSRSRPPQLSRPSRRHHLAPLVIVVAYHNSCISLHHLARACRTHRFSSRRVVPLF